MLPHNISHQQLQRPITGRSACFITTALHAFVCTTLVLSLYIYQVTRPLVKPVAKWFYFAVWRWRLCDGEWCYCPFHPLLFVFSFFSPTSVVKLGEAVNRLPLALPLDVSHCNSSRLKHTHINVEQQAGVLKAKGNAGGKVPWKTIHTFWTFFLTLWHVTTTNSKWYMVFNTKKSEL